jgi:hypothetical protein
MEIVRRYLVIPLISRPEIDDNKLFRELFGEQILSKLERGMSYLVKEKRNERGMDLFMKQIAEGYTGLYITRHHPKHISKNYLTNGMTIIWLSTTLGANYIDPHNLSTLFNTIKTFVEKNEKCIIFLDGIEYLMINNVYIRIVKLIEHIKEMMVQSNSILLISLDERAFEPKELSLIEKGLKPVDS